MGRGRNAIEVQGLDVGRVAENSPEFHGEMVDLVVGQGETGQFGDVSDVGTRNGISHEPASLEVDAPAASYL